MSDRPTPVSHPHRTTRAALVAGLVAVGCAMLTGPAVGSAAQPTANPPGELGTVDERPPLPPEQPKLPPVRAKYRVPDQDRAMFLGYKDPKTGTVTGGIEDEKPLASEKQNQDEYNAWTEVVRHARQFTAAELAEHGVRDLTPDDLTFPSVRKYSRLELVRFDGQLMKARRVRATKALEAIGLEEVYEGWLLPPDEPPGNALCVVFTDWPADLPAPPEILPGHMGGESVTIDKWVAFGGYFFKLMLYPGPGADPNDPRGAGWSKAALLAGRSVTLLPGPPPAATSIALDKNLRVFKLIRDNTPSGRTQSTWEELAAWNRVVLHARKFTPEDLETAANHDLKFADLYEPHRTDYKLDLVSFQGRLIRLKKGEPTQRLTEAGVSAWYEGWLVPDGEPRGNPVCIVFTDLPPGLVPKPLMNVPVSFAGYSFKLLQYESGEQKKDDPSKHVWKGAPLLIGRSVIIRGTEDADGPSTWASWFVPAIVGGLLLLIGTALTMSWWFRQGDRRARDEIDATRGKNPFAENSM
ncbi:MAG: hypothetical protein JWO38_5798 [Gemmataceae bacterium]|nr:hypothetical protein [Gemmataceae bacterium]